jgi:hypothetical protein
MGTVKDCNSKIENELTVGDTLDLDLGGHYAQRTLTYAGRDEEGDFVFVGSGTKISAHPSRGDVAPFVIDTGGNRKKIYAFVGFGLGEDLVNDGKTRLVFEGGELRW